jgi:hypothetical protein
MKTTTKSKPSVARRAARPASPSVARKGDDLRAMFAQWEKEHHDPKPISWDKFQAVMEENRLREAPLFSK